MRAGDARNLVTVMRRNETRDAYGDVAAGYASAGTAWVAITREQGTVVDYGAGDQPRERARGRAHYLADIRIRDVLQVTDGPEAATNWEAVGVLHPGGRDCDLTLERYTGSLS